MSAMASAWHTNPYESLKIVKTMVVGRSREIEFSTSKFAMNWKKVDDMAYAFLVVNRFFCCICGSIDVSATALVSIIWSNPNRCFI